MGNELHISLFVSSDCWNMEAWAFGICHQCGCCSKDERKRYESRIRLIEERLDDLRAFRNWFDDPASRAFQEKNVASNIKWAERRLRYYKKKLSEMEDKADAEVC